VDPNEKLRLEAERKAVDLRQWRTERVVGWKATTSVSKSGNPTKMVKVVTDTQHSFTFWVQLSPKHPDARALLRMFSALDGMMPATITYRKNGTFYEVKDLNHEVTA
jgi:hypothetical protein